MKAIESYTNRLEVPQGLRWHHIVYTTLLTPFRRQDEPQDMEKDKKEMWEVKEIVNSRRIKGHVLYQVWRTGCSELEARWETFEYLDNCPGKLQEFRY